MSDDATLPETGADEQGLRLHFLGLFVNFITGLRQLIFPIVAAFFGTRGINSPGLSVAIIGAVLVISLLFRLLAWLRFRYFIGEYDIRIEKGIFSRTARSIPYERIQDVSVEQRLLARILNLAEVKFETGGGQADEAKLNYVSTSEAERLREVVRERKEDEVVPVAKEGTANVEEDRPIFAMDSRRVFTYGLYSFSLVIFAVLFGAAQQLDFLLPFEFWDFGAWIGVAQDRGVNIDTITHIGMAARVIGGLLALVGLIFVGLASGIISTALRDYGFRLDRTAKGFRRRRGLFTLTDVVMPAHRVQAATIQTGPIRKLRGWHGLRFISLSQDSKKEEDYSAAPFAKLDEIWPIVEAAALMPPTEETAFHRGSSRLWLLQMLAMIVLAGTAIFAVANFVEGGFRAGYALLPIALIIIGTRLSARRYRYAQDARQIYVRKGWWREQLQIAPQIKVQSVEVSQGPISRQLGLATLHFGIAGGSMHMPSLPLTTARTIRDAVADTIAKVDYSAINKPV